MIIGTTLSACVIAALLSTAAPLPAPPPAATPAPAEARPSGPPTLEKPGWCVVVASPALTGYARAAKAAERARAAGFPRAGVYDTREFSDLTWGQLAVIATLEPNEEAATAASKVLRKARVDAYSKPCTPAPTARPLSRAPALPTFEGGCFAWSKKLGTAACVTGAQSIQGGAQWDVVFPGAALQAVSLVKLEPQVLDPVPLVPTRAAMGDISDRLREGGFVALTGASAPLEPGVAAVAGRARVTWTRKGEGTVSEPGGSWPEFSDTFAVRCPDGHTVELGERSSENTEPADATLRTVEDGRYLIVEFWASWGIEGDLGDFRDAWVFDVQEDCRR